MSSKFFLIVCHFWAFSGVPILQRALRVNVWQVIFVWPKILGLTLFDTDSLLIIMSKVFWSMNQNILKQTNNDSLSSFSSLSPLDVTFRNIILPTIWKCKILKVDNIFCRDFLKTSPGKPATGAIISKELKKQWLTCLRVRTVSKKICEITHV